MNKVAKFYDKYDKFVDFKMECWYAKDRPPKNNFDILVANKSIKAIFG